MSKYYDSFNIKNLKLLLSNHYFVYFIFSLFLIYWFRFLISFEVLNSVDLNSHIQHISLYKELWYKSLYSYYIADSFTGWSALHFYGFFPYLITVVISYVFDLFTSDSVRLSTHIIILLGLSGLIFSINYASRPLIDTYIKKIPNEYKLIVKLISAFTLCTFCFWFLNKSNSYFGEGAGAITTFGLYTQLFGWHLLLIYLGLLLRFVYYHNNDHYYKYLSIVLSISIITHTVTATLLIIITLFYLLISDKRYLLFKSIVFGLLLCSFWFIPFISHLGEYSRYNPQTSNEFLNILLYYPIYSTLLSVISTLKGNVVILDFTNILILLLICIAFIHRKLHRDRIFVTLVIFILFFVLITNGNFPLNNFLLGLHYYRYYGLIFLIFTILFSTIFLSLISEIISKYNKNIKSYIFLSITCFLLLLSFVTTLYFPNTWHKRNNNNNNYSVQNRVVSTIKNIQSDSRIYVEYMKNYTQIKPKISHHYLSSVFFNDKETESASGLFIEQNNSSNYISTSLQYLDAEIYKTPIFKDLSRFSIDKDTAIDQLKNFGINFLVSGTDKFYNSIKSYSLIEPIKIGNYRIVQINKEHHRNVEITKKIPIGYLDLKNNLKFNHIDYYFYLNKYLTNNYELIKIDSLDKVPSQISTLIINYLPEDIDKFVTKNNLENKKIIFLNFENLLLIINHYTPYYPDNIDMDTYKLIRKYFNENINLERQLKTIHTNIKPQSNENNDIKSKVIWSDNKQIFKLTNLVPRKIYRINYGYFPYWHTNDGKLYRGSADRMFFIPNNTEAVFKFTKMKSISTWIGILLSLICVLYFVMEPYINTHIFHIKNNINN